jgi:hypothetical protein
MSWPSGCSHVSPWGSPRGGGRKPQRLATSVEVISLMRRLNSDTRPLWDTVEPVIASPLRVFGPAKQNKLMVILYLTQETLPSPLSSGSPGFHQRRDGSLHGSRRVRGVSLSGSPDFVPRHGKGCLPLRHSALEVTMRYTTKEGDGSLHGSCCVRGGSPRGDNPSLLSRLSSRFGCDGRWL